MIKKKKMRKLRSMALNADADVVLSRAQMKNVLGGTAPACPLAVCSGGDETCVAYGTVLEGPDSACSIWCNGILKCVAG
jgi:hypothetical protein